MTVKKKIELEITEIDAIKYIKRGAEVKIDSVDLKPIKTISVYIPTDFLEEINLKVKKRVGLSRNAWILEALQDKMEKE